MPTYQLELDGQTVTLYIDTGTEKLLVDEGWLEDKFPKIYATRYAGERWIVNGVGEEGQSTKLTSDHSVMIPLDNQSKENGVSVTSSMSHEALLVRRLGEPIIAGRSWQDAAELTIHRSKDPAKRRITSEVYNDQQKGTTRAEYDQWKRTDTAIAVRNAMRTTTAYRTLLEHQPKNTLEGEKLKTVDALFREDSSTAGRR